MQKTIDELYHVNQKIVILIKMMHVDLFLQILHVNNGELVNVQMVRAIAISFVHLIR